MRIFPLISFLGLQIVQKLFHIVMFHLELLRKVRKTVIFLQVIIKKELTYINSSLTRMTTSISCMGGQSEK